MGDHGRAYSSITETHVQKMKELLPLADIITPNITEACLLTGTPWKDGEWTMQELSGLCLKLATLCQTDSTLSLSEHFHDASNSVIDTSRTCFPSHFHRHHRNPAGRFSGELPMG